MGAGIARHPERISERRPGLRSGPRAVHAGRAPLRPALVRRVEEAHQQSEKALAQGEVDRAYEKARAALRKDPENERARRRAPLRRRPEGGRHEGARAAVAAVRDTVAAARYCLDIDAFRRELAEYRVMPATDAAFDRDASSLRHAAARALVRSADEAMDAGHPRAAYRDLEAAREMEAAFRASTRGSARRTRRRSTGSRSCRSRTRPRPPAWRAS